MHLNNTVCHSFQMYFSRSFNKISELWQFAVRLFLVLHFHVLILTTKNAHFVDCVYDLFIMKLCNKISGSMFPLAFINSTCAEMA